MDTFSNGPFEERLFSKSILSIFPVSIKNETKGFSIRFIFNYLSPTCADRRLSRALPDQNDESIKIPSYCILS
jgi:hypothetical protein